jgi:ribose/xylose/arabinose/galactoside ABC-type transport system permease subunit
MRSARQRPTDLLGVFGPYLGLFLVVVIFSFLILWARGPSGLGLFLSVDNFKLVVVHAAVPAAVGLGMTIVMISGGIDLSVGYVVSLVTVTSMLVYRWAAGQESLAEFASLLAIAAGLGTGVLAGFTNAFLITRLKLLPFIVTLGTMGMARGLAQYLTNGRPVPFPDPSRPPRWLHWLGAIKPEPAWLGIGPSSWSVLLAALLLAFQLRYTALGRYCYALGSNETAARLCGIRVERTKLILYTLAGLLTAWGGILQLARSGAGLHDVAAGLELDVIAAVVVGGGSLTGGEGTVTGTLIGSLMIALLTNGCSKLGLPMEFRFIIIGLIIVLVSAVNVWRQRAWRST